MRHIFISSTEHKHRAVAKNGRVVRVLSWQGGELMSGSGAHNDDGSDEDGDEDICNDVPEHVQFYESKKRATSSHSSSSLRIQQLLADQASLTIFLSAAR